MKKENIIDIITDEDGRKIVVITDIRFKGKRKAYVNRMIKGKDGVVNKDFVQEKNPKMPWTTSFP